MNLKKQIERYRNDAEFHALVRQFRGLLEQGTVSIGECKDALNLAATMLASERLDPLICGRLAEYRFKETERI